MGIRSIPCFWFTKDTGDVIPQAARTPKGEGIASPLAQVVNRYSITPPSTNALFHFLLCSPSVSSMFISVAIPSSPPPCTSSTSPPPNLPPTPSSVANLGKAVTMRLLLSSIICHRFGFIPSR